MRETDYALMHYYFGLPTGFLSQYTNGTHGKLFYAQLARPLFRRATRLALVLVRMLGPTLVLALRPSYGAPDLADSRRSQRE
jgi:hypothetical protein